MQPLRLSLLLIPGFLLAACGGGDDSVPPPSTPIYTGLETEAKITAINAASFVTEMFGVGGTSISLSATDTEAPKPEPYNIRVPLALSASIENINAENVPSTTGSLATFYSEIRECTQGMVDYTINVNASDGSFNGSMNYSDCLVDGFVLLGSADVYGEYDLTANQFVSITLDFPWLRASNDSVEYVAANSVSVDLAETTTTATLEDTVVTIDGRQEVQFQGFAIQVTTDATDQTQTLTLSGRFYHPTYGFVTVATDTVLEFTEDLVWPYDGFLTMTGDSSSLHVLCEDQPTFTLWVDSDGDGIYDDQGDGDKSITASW